MGTTTQDLVAQVRLLSNLRRNNYFTDVDISEFIADGGKELGDIFIAAYEHHFQDEFDFSLTNGADGSGSNVVPLPADFQKTNILMRNSGQGGPEIIRMLANLLQRNGTNSAIWGPGGRRYFVGAAQQTPTLEVLPASMAQGDYRLLYTPQFPNLAFPRTPDFTVGVASVASTPGSGFGMSPSGSEPGTVWTATTDSPWIMNGVNVETLSPPFMLLIDRPDPSQNGVFIRAGGGMGTWTLVRYTDPPGGVFPVYPTRGQTVLVTGGDVGAGYYVETADVETIDVDPVIFEPPALPNALMPWERYLKVYAALTIRRARMQGANDLELEMQQLKERAAKMSANRNEEPTQAPIERGRRRGWWGGAGGF